MQFRRENSGAVIPVGRVNSAPELPRALPFEIIDHIFSLFPIKNAVQIGVLSKRFKCAWLFNQNLIFDSDIARKYTRTSFMGIISRIFKLHEGKSIKCFSLYIDPTGVELLINKWIEIAISKGVEELDLDFSSKKNVLDRPVITLREPYSVRILKLCLVEINFIPSTLTLGSMSLLDTLVFRGVKLTDQMVDVVLNNCKLLETLDMVICDGTQYLKIRARALKRFKALKIGNFTGISWVEIDAPTLQSFYFYGDIPEFILVDVKMVNDVYLNFKVMSLMKCHRVENILERFKRVNVLTITAPLIEFFIVDMIHAPRMRARNSLWNLRELQLFMEDSNYCNALDVAHLLTYCCPRIQKVFIDFGLGTFPATAYYKINRPKLDEVPGFLHHLKLVRMTGFVFRQQELDLVKFFLKKGKNLENLVLSTPKSSNPCYRDKRHLLPLSAIYPNLVLWRTSTRAKISVFEEFMDEDKAIFPFHSREWW